MLIIAERYKATGAVIVIIFGEKNSVCSGKTLIPRNGWTKPADDCIFKVQYTILKCQPS